MFLGGGVRSLRLPAVSTVVSGLGLALFMLRGSWACFGCYSHFLASRYLNLEKY